MVSDACHVFSYFPCAWLLRPKLNSLSEIGGTDCQFDGPELMIPSVPGPVANPRLDKDTVGSVGSPVRPALRVKSRRASFTVDGFSALVFAITACCARVLFWLLKFPYCDP